MIGRALLATVGAGLALGSAGGSGARIEPQVGELSWAPGPAIVFGAVHGGVYTVSPSGSGPHRVATLRNAYPSWSPDGRSLLIGSNRVLYRVSGGAVHRLRAGYSAVWSPDGKQFAFSGPSGLSVARADGTHAVKLAKLYSDTDPPPAWSPDGRRIAYATCFAPGSQGCEQGGGKSVFVVSVQGGASRRITPETLNVGCVAWSSRGSISFGTGENATGIVGDGGRIRMFTPGGCPSAWSPDGRRYVVAVARGLGFLNADGTGRRYLNLTKRLGKFTLLSYPVWSPDGKYVALIVMPYHGSPDTHNELYVVRPDGGDLRRIALPSG